MEWNFHLSSKLYKWSVTSSFTDLIFRSYHRMSHLCRSGHRRFRLCSKKNSERKKYNKRNKPPTLPVSNDADSVLKISLPIELLSFSVSIPLEAFLDSPANSLTTLKSRLVAAKVISQGWYFVMLQFEPFSGHVYPIIVCVHRLIDLFRRYILSMIDYNIISMCYLF